MKRRVERKRKKEKEKEKERERNCNRNWITGQFIFAVVRFEPVLTDLAESKSC
jgi:hypothetical protein